LRGVLSIFALAKMATTSYKVTTYLYNCFYLLNLYGGGVATILTTYNRIWWWCGDYFDYLQ